MDGRIRWIDADVSLSTCTALKPPYFSSEELDLDEVLVEELQRKLVPSLVLGLALAIVQVTPC